MKQNYKLTVAYDGTRYYGWEHQPNTEMTIQGKLETVLSRMAGLPEGESVTVIGAGRTDAGVHARAMTANVLLDTQMTPEEIGRYMNRYLPEDICVRDVKVCADRFHSRFKAIGKLYVYTCYVGEDKPVFDRKYVTVLEERPDTARMREAAEYLVGTHDFKAFCGNPHMKKSTVRHLRSIEITEDGPYLRIAYQGNGFLQNMVRILTGTLIEAGCGRIDPARIPEILESRDRSQAGPTMPPQGLTLVRVDY